MSQSDTFSVDVLVRLYSCEDSEGNDLDADFSIDSDGDISITIKDRLLPPDEVEMLKMLISDEFDPAEYQEFLEWKANQNSEM